MPIPEIKQAKDLTKQVHALQELLLKSQKENDRLKLEHALLTAMSDNLGWLRDRHVEELPGGKEPQKQGSEQQDEGLALQLSGSLDDGTDYLSELLLLEELGSPQTQPCESASCCDQQLSACTVIRQHSSSISSACSSPYQSLRPSSTVASPATIDSSIWATTGPEGFKPAGWQPPRQLTPSVEEKTSATEAEQPLDAADNMQMLFRQLLSPRTVWSVHEPISLQQLQSLYMLTVHELSMLLSLLDNPFICSKPTQDAQNPATALEAAIHRYFRAVAKLGLEGRGHLLNLFTVTNLLTGQFVDEVRVRQQMVWAVETAGISAEQLKKVAAGHVLSDRLLGAVLEERHNSLSQVAEVLEETCWRPLGRSHDLEEQVDHLEVAKLAVSMFPYPLNLTTVECVADQLVKRGETNA